MSTANDLNDVMESSGGRDANLVLPYTSPF